MCTALRWVCIGPILPVPRLRFQNIGDGIHAPNRSHCRLCDHHEPCSDVRTRPDTGGCGIRQPHANSSSTRSGCNAVRIRAEDGPVATAESHELAVAEFFGWDFSDGKPAFKSIVSDRLLLIDCKHA